jgi:hypothetical protein
VNGLSVGTVNYSFSDDGAFREWVVDIDGYGESDQYLPAMGTSAMQITVTPEPGALMLFIIVGAMIMRGTRMNL